MWRATWKEVLSRPLRLLLTATAVLLGVMFVTGTLVLTDTTQRRFEDLFSDANAGVDVVVRKAVAFDSAMGVEVARDTLDAAMVEEVRQVAGVASAQGLLRGQALMLTADGDPILPKAESSATSVGMSWASEPYGSFRIRDGHPPADSNDVVIDAATAQDQGLNVGDSVSVQGPTGRTQPYHIVGTAGFGERNGLAGATVALFTLPTAQQLLNSPHGVSDIAVVAEDGLPAGQLRDRLITALGGSYEVATAQDSAAASATAAREQTAMLQTVFTIFGAVALLVGAFLIANTFSILVAQRSREFAMLRAVGATGRQVTVAVLFEALIVGLLASVAGAALGVVAALGLRQLAAAFGTEIPPGPLVVTNTALLSGIAIGVTVTLLAAIGPARRAALIAPVAALRAAADPDGIPRRTRTLLGAVATLLGAGLGMAAGVGAGNGLADRGPVPLLLTVGAGAVLVVVGLAWLAPAGAQALGRVLVAPVARLGAPAGLAVSGALRASRRSAATAGALAVGLALVVFFSVFLTSIKASVTGSLDDVIRADLIVESSRNEMLGGLPPHTYHHVSEVPEVAVASSTRLGHWRDGDTVRALTAVDPATIGDVTNLNITAGNFDALRRSGIMLTDAEARIHDVRIGDSLPMSFPRTGTERLRVVALFDADDEWALQTGFVIGLDTYARHFNEDVDASILLRFKPGVSASEGTAAVRSALADTPTAVARDLAALESARSNTIDQILGLMNVLLLLAVLIALLGITNTLALSIVERTRELGLLRAVGMVRGQVSAMVRWEALLIAALGAVAGLLVGVGFGTAAVSASATSADTAMNLHLPVLPLLGYTIAGIVAGLLAGVLPARRASRLDVLNAIASP
jgi:putative ABC transport system permease protein